MQIIVGRIGRPHGVRGDLVVGVRTDEPDARFVVGARLDTDPADVGPLTVDAVRWHSGELIVRFAGVTDRTVAGNLTGTWLSVDSDTLDVPQDPDEFRDYQLIDLTVRTKDGEVVGVVSDVLHHGQDVLAIRPAADPRGELLVPFVKAIVTEVDLASGTLLIDPPPGLLNPAEAQ
ncbi:MAG TPA: ribosome maturation factor RimM [Trebonia sp.]|jgi:16S rRNA processing protein RimM|nr:ribosome maturation factor RimM [Trebonia sp.]